MVLTEDNCSLFNNDILRLITSFRTPTLDFVVWRESIKIVNGIFENSLTRSSHVSVRCKAWWEFHTDWRIISERKRYMPRSGHLFIKRNADFKQVCKNGRIEFVDYVYVSGCQKVLYKISRTNKRIWRCHCNTGGKNLFPIGHKYWL